MTPETIIFTSIVEMPLSTEPHSVFLLTTNNYKIGLHLNLLLQFDYFKNLEIKENIIEFQFHHTTTHEFQKLIYNGSLDIKTQFGPKKLMDLYRLGEKINLISLKNATRRKIVSWVTSAKNLEDRIHLYEFFFVQRPNIFSEISKHQTGLLTKIYDSFTLQNIDLLYQFSLRNSFKDLKLKCLESMDLKRKFGTNIFMIRNQDSHFLFK